MSSSCGKTTEAGRTPGRDPGRQPRGVADERFGLGESFPALIGVLTEARGYGYLGPGPVQPHVRHALGFSAAVGSAPQGLCVDLGSGAGLPGLPLALLWPSTRWLLLEAGSKRAGFLQEAVERLGLDGRVVVEQDRAEVAGRSEGRRGEAELVVARGFGPPATTAECASPLLRVGGALVVSEPPGAGGPEDGGDPDRWPEEGLALLGLARGKRFEVLTGGYQRLDQELACPARYPRRDGVPRKRPLW